MAASKKLGVMTLEFGLSVDLDSVPHQALCFCVGFVHCSQNLQIRFCENFSLKLGFMILFTHLKIILLQYF